MPVFGSISTTNDDPYVANNNKYPTDDSWGSMRIYQGIQNTIHDLDNKKLLHLKGFVQSFLDLNMYFLAFSFIYI